MNGQTDTQAIERGISADAELVHRACEHDEDTALCGEDLTGASDVDDDMDCNVCAYMDAYYDQIGVCCRIGEANA